MENNNKCTPKEKIAIITAVAAFALGWTLTIAGFIVPPLGDISNSVLFVLGQALIYTASVFGITQYFKSEAVQMKSDVANFLVEKEKLMNERIMLKQNIDKGELPNENG